MLTNLPHTGLDNIAFDNIRSEDIKFSPSGRILAAVATNGILYLFAVDAESRPVRITKTTELRSSSLVSPHGIDFISENIVVVANRGAWLTFYRLPTVGSWKDRGEIHHIHEMNAPWFGAKGSMRAQGERQVFCGPGSVRIRDNELFVCCNNKGTVSRHPFTCWWRWVRTGEGALVATDGLVIPDGLSFSRDHAWTAIGEHEHQRIGIHKGIAPSPQCILTDPDLHHPHGLCFDSTGKVLFVADAGERDIHAFATTDDWQSSVEKSSFKISAVEEEAYEKTRAVVDKRYWPLEGGIKGLDVDPAGKVIATTCQHQMLRFFAVE